MKRTARRAVDPIIASLLLIAIAVAAGVIVYVYVNSLASGLTGAGGQQVADQISLDAYNYGTIASGAVVTVRDTGTSSVTITDIFFDGAPITSISSNSGSCTSQSTSTPFATCATGQTLTFTITGGGATTSKSGTNHSIKIITATGGTSVFSVIAGRTG